MSSGTPEGKPALDHESITKAGLKAFHLGTVHFHIDAVFKAGLSGCGWV